MSNLRSEIKNLWLTRVLLSTLESSQSTGSLFFCQFLQFMYLYCLDLQNWALIPLPSSLIIDFWSGIWKCNHCMVNFGWLRSNLSTHWKMLSWAKLRVLNRDFRDVRWIVHQDSIQGVLVLAQHSFRYTYLWVFFYVTLADLLDWKCFFCCNIQFESLWNI